MTHLANRDLPGSGGRHGNLLTSVGGWAPGCVEQAHGESQPHHHRTRGHCRCRPGQVGLLGFVTCATRVQGQRSRSVWKEATGSQWGDPPTGPQ